MTKYVIAIAIECPYGLCLFGRRSRSSKEYLGFWSLPTLKVTHAVYRRVISSKRLPPSVSNLFARGRLPGIRLSAMRWLASTVRCRTKYRIEMAVFAARGENIPKNSEKYSALAMLRPEQALSRNRGVAGTCFSLYLQHLVTAGVLSPTIGYLELPPEIADSTRAPEEFSEQELWRLSSRNHALLLRGLIGRDGAFLRKLALDPYLSRFVRTRIRTSDRVLDIGCGSGRLLSAIRTKTGVAYGMDIEPPFLSGWRAQYIRRGDLYTIGCTFDRMKFDIVILNLMVQWIGDLDRFLDSLRSVLDSDARVLATTTAPEFTRNVHWCDNRWQIEKKPDRDRELTMINGVVGPVWLYPRSTAQYIETFARHRLLCVGAKNLYVDTYLTPSEKESVLRREPSLVRNTIVPLFCAFEFQTARDRRREG